MENREVARVLRETAQLLEIDGALIGRYRSYEKAAELIASLAESIEVIARDPEKLEELPGIGERMAEHIREILSTGDYALRKKLLQEISAADSRTAHAAIAGPQEGADSLARIQMLHRRAGGAAGARGQAARTWPASARRRNKTSSRPSRSSRRRRAAS